MCQVSFLSSWEKEMNQKSRFQPADCDLRSALQPRLRAARVWRQGVGVEGKGKGGSCVMFSHQNCLRAGRVEGRGMQGGRAQGRAEEWWQLGRWQGALPGRTGSKETAPQTVSERFPAGQHSLTSSTPSQSPKGEQIILLIWPRLPSFKRESGIWIWEKHVLVREPSCFPNLKTTLRREK